MFGQCIVLCLGYSLKLSILIQQNYPYLFNRTIHTYSTDIWYPCKGPSWLWTSPGYRWPFTSSCWTPSQVSQAQAQFFPVREVCQIPEVQIQVQVQGAKVARHTRSWSCLSRGRRGHHQFISRDVPGYYQGVAYYVVAHVFQAWWAQLHSDPRLIIQNDQNNQKPSSTNSFVQKSQES